MIRCLHLADLHLGWEPSFLGPRAAHRQRERDDLLRRIVDYALANGVDLVIIAGDLFETHRPPADLADAVRRDLRRLDQAGVAVVTVPGNHDEITYHDSVYRQGDWPGVLVQNPTVDKVATLSIKGQDCHFYSLAYTGGLTPSDPLTEFPRSDEQGFHIAVFHGTLDWNPGERSLPLQSAALAAANYHYTALGHIHRHSVHRSGPGGPLVYAGAVEGKGFHDLGTGQLVLAELDRERTTVTTVPLAVRPCRVVEVDVGHLADVDELHQSLGALADKEAIVRLRLTGTAGFHYRIDDELAAQFYYLEIQDDADYLADAAVAALAAEQTVRGEFVRVMQKIIAAADDSQRPVFWRALRRGLAALDGSEGR